MPSPPREIGRGKRRLIIEGMPERKTRRWWKYLLGLVVLAGAAFVFFICSREPMITKKKKKPKTARRSVKPSRPPLRTAPFKPASAAPTLTPRFHVRPSRFSGRIWKHVQRIEPQLRALRRELHANPELANRETKTGDLLIKKLRPLGLKIKKGVALTGVTARLTGARPGPAVALLAYMDGMPVKEENITRHASKARGRLRGRTVGVSHASGHDVEMAVLVGAARVLNTLKSHLPGTVKFIFQPAGEGAPTGEKGGAREMIRHGVLVNPQVEALFAVTVQPRLRKGRAGFPSERWWQGITYFTVAVRGRNLDACLKPDSTGCVDPVLASSQLVVSLQALASKQLAAGRSTRLVVQQIDSGKTKGRLPSRVTLKGTVRWKFRRDRERAVALIRRTVRGASVSSRAHMQVNFREGRRTIPSDPKIIQWLLPTLRRALGQRGVAMGTPGIVDEQFARYRRYVPGVQIQLGTHSARLRTRRRLGTPTFDVDEECISVGVHLLANAVMDYLQERAKTRAARKPPQPTTTGTTTTPATKPRTPSAGKSPARPALTRPTSTRPTSTRPTSTRPTRPRTTRPRKPSAR